VQNLVTWVAMLVVVSVPAGIAGGPTVVLRRDLPLALWIGAPLALWAGFGAAAVPREGGLLATLLWTGFAVGSGLATWVRPEEPLQHSVPVLGLATFGLTSIAATIALSATPWAGPAAIVWFATLPVPLLLLRRGPRNDRVLHGVATLALLAVVPVVGGHAVNGARLGPLTGLVVHAVVTYGLTVARLRSADWAPLAAALVAASVLVWPADLLAWQRRAREVEARLAWDRLPELRGFTSASGGSYSPLQLETCLIDAGAPRPRGCRQAAVLVDAQAPWTATYPGTRGLWVLTTGGGAAEDWPADARYRMFDLWRATAVSAPVLQADAAGQVQVPGAPAAPMGPAAVDALVAALPQRSELVVPPDLPWSVQDVISLCADLGERGVHCRGTP
jgi:hypothetical protein